MRKLKYLLFIPLILATGCTTSDATYHYDETGYQELEGTTLSLDNIHNVNINWVNGNVFCTQSQSEVIVLEETESEHPLYYKIKDGELSIQLVKSGTSSRVIDKLNKDLSITFPVSLYNLSMNLVKTNAKMDGKIALEKGDYNLVDGKCSFNAYSASESDFNLVSADLDIKQVDVNYLTKEVVNGDIVQYTSEPQKHKIDVNVTNASVKFGIDSEIGYKLDWSQVESRYICEYGEGRYEYGNKLIEMEVKAITTDFKIAKIATK